VGRGTVPEEIANILNLCDDNFQGQKEGQYGFSLTPGQLSKKLNDIVNLSAIDRTLANAAKAVRKGKSKVEHTQERVAAAKKVKKSLAWVPGMVKELKGITKLNDQKQRLEYEVELLERLIAEATKLEKRRLQFDYVGFKKEVKEIDAMIKKVSKYTKDIEKLESLIAQCTNLGERQCLARKKLTRIENQLHRKMKGRCPLCGKDLA
jgi:DNA repair exonuclease SbcCD ATPase subunit